MTPRKPTLDICGAIGPKKLEVVDAAHDRAANGGKVANARAVP